MAEQRKKDGRPSAASSLLIKCAGLMLAVAVAVAGTLTLFSLSSSKQVAEDGVKTMATEMSGLLAGQLGGAVRFGRTEVVEGALNDTLEQMGGYLAHASVVTADGTLVSEVGRMSEDARDLSSALLGEALDSGSVRASDDGLTLAVPIGFGDANATVGTLLIEWSTAPANTTLVANKQMALGVAALTSLIAVTLAGLLLRSLITTPLRRLANGMSAVASGDYDLEVSGDERRDEIGLIARALEGSRARLSAARESAKDATFKGAGFQSSSTPLAMLDKSGALTHFNAAFNDFASDPKVGLLANRDDGGTASWAGQTLVELNPSLSVAAAKIAEAAQFPIEFEISLGQKHVVLVVSDVQTKSGERLGFVVEWRDITRARMNTAIVRSLEENQPQAIYAPDGSFVRANALYAQATGYGESELASLKIDAVLSALTSADGESQDARDLISGTAPQFGTLRLKGKGDAVVYLQGGLCPIQDRAGTPLAVVLMGADITAASRAAEEAQTARKEIEAGQKTMIDALRDGLARIADGDLQVRIGEPFMEGYDRVRVDFNETVASLDVVMSTVNKQSRAIQVDVSEITTAGDNLSRRTEQQAATLEETAAALAEITSSVAEAADGARQANQVVTEARSNAEDSGSVVEEAVGAMSQISDSSSRISKIITVIDDIAFQTNLLALNAGVEAARAGDAGRGFAVVASEVRALAQRSSDAAHEIGQLISTSGEHVQSGVTLVGNAGDALKRIVSSVTEIADYVSAIASSTQAQSSRLDEIKPVKPLREFAV